MQDADDGDTTTSIETLIESAEQVEAVRPDADGIEEVIGDKGYHSNQSLVDLEAVGVRSYISEPDRGRRNWKKHSAARDAVYRNRRRIRGARGQRLLRLRGERLERLFAHLFETGGRRRVYLRGHANIRKRLLIHGLLMRHVIGVGTRPPRPTRRGARHSPQADSRDQAARDAPLAFLPTLFSAERASLARFDLTPMGASKDGLNHGLLAAHQLGFQIAGGLGNPFLTTADNRKVDEELDNVAAAKVLDDGDP